MLKKILLRAYRINSKWIWFLVSHSFSREDSELRLSTSKNDTVVTRLTTTLNIAVNKEENGGGGEGGGGGGKRERVSILVQISTKIPPTPDIAVARNTLRVVVIKREGRNGRQETE